MRVLVRSAALLLLALGLSCASEAAHYDPSMMMRRVQKKTSTNKKGSKTSKPTNQPTISAAPTVSAAPVTAKSAKKNAAKKSKKTTTAPVAAPAPTTEAPSKAPTKAPMPTPPVCNPTVCGACVVGGTGGFCKDTGPGLNCFMCMPVCGTGPNCACVDSSSLFN